MAKENIALRNCQFAFRCSKTWESLGATDKNQVKFCNDCDREVYFCATDQELSEAIEKNRCVALVVSGELHAPGNERLILGELEPTPYDVGS